MSTPPRSLFRRLVDDAAMFPPGNASADEAIQEHLRYRASWFADLVGPLLVPARAFEAFTDAQAAAGSPVLSIVLIGTTSLPHLVPRGVTVVGFEVPVADLPLPSVPAGSTLAAEIKPGVGGCRVLEAAARTTGVVGKLRTGGETAQAFPTEDELAEVLWSANALGAPLKLTAGLHHAVRHTDLATGFEHHGFLNVLAAVLVAMTKAERPRVADMLAERSGERLVADLGRVDERRVLQLRRRFVSFGCCGVEDPIGDLVGLGLVTPEEIA